MKKNKDFYLPTQLNLPYEGSNIFIIGKIFDKLKHDYNLTIGSKQKFIDLGSGDGRVVIYCATHYKIKSLGLEINPSLFEESKKALKTLKSSRKRHKLIKKYISFKFRDLFTFNLNKYDYIFVYPLPTITNYMKHIFKKMNKDAILISYKYPINNCDNIIRLEEDYKITHGNKKIHAYFYKKQT